MNRTDAEKLADDIFDMIDRNHPRGLIKSELVDLLAGDRPAAQETLPFPPKPALCEAGGDDVKTPPDTDDWVPLIDLVEEAKKALRHPSGGYYYISTAGTSPQIYANMTEDDHWTEEVMERLHEVNRHFGKDPCGND